MEKFYQRPGFPWLLVLLLIGINITLVAFIWLRPGRHQDHPRRLIPIAEILHFDAGQAAALKDLQKAHFAVTDSLRAAAKLQREGLFGLLKGGQPDSAASRQGIDGLARLQGQIEGEVFDHFRQVRLLCQPEQRAFFDGDLLEQISRQAPPGRPGGPKDHSGPPPPRP
jgi:periplasmic protein CpxP/Spy